MDDQVGALSARAHSALQVITTRLGAASTRELAVCLGATQSEVCETLIELEHDGLVEPVVWRVTAEGRAVARSETR
jgi:Mn-dependent DtxR family transcriptional regulator